MLKNKTLILSMFTTLNILSADRSDNYDRPSRFSSASSSAFSSTSAFSPTSFVESHKRVLKSLEDRELARSVSPLEILKAMGCPINTEEPWANIVDAQEKADKIRELNQSSPTYASVAAASVANQ